MDPISTVVKYEIVKPQKRHDNELMVVSRPFEFGNPPFDPELFAKDIATRMIQENGLGLAAIQIGVPYRVFAVRTDPIQVCFNPKIVDASGDFLPAEEGCLSFPNMFVKVKRYDHIRLRFQLHNGAFVTRKFEGLAARIVQHEQDHLDGILFYNRASTFHRDQALRKWERTLKKASALNTSVVPRSLTLDEEQLVWQALHDSSPKPENVSETK